ncbi:RNA polymerase sigma factor [Solibacillus sp. FSL K6-4121]|uniref:RNA polymerase sigma factor n=1 Tax=Solibacillus sp. FSL K6-4121 TaxID=2921505 RepID=UPI0030FCB925
MQHKMMTIANKQSFTHAMDELIEAYYDKIYKYCFSLLRNTYDAEDAVQEVFIKAMKHGKLASIENPNAWLYKISYFHCLNKIKRKKLKSFIPFIEQEAKTAVFDHDNDDQLESILVHLKPEERSLLLLRVIENYSFEEIGQIFEKPPATIRKRYERLKIKVKNLL